MHIREYRDEDVEAIVELSIRAWQPVFASMEAIMDPKVFGHFYPDWRVDQAKAVRTVCTAKEQAVFVAECDGAPAGFVATKVDHESKMGEIYMVAVDPPCQRRGIGRALTDFATEQLRQAGMKVAMVETGGDPGHGPARRTYEQAGYRLLPVARYFKAL